MGAKTVITDRSVMQQAPPDILLTNYKMLDYLLLRPGDQGVWQHNGPGSLRFLVVDEIHTFDGAPDPLPDTPDGEAGADNLMYPVVTAAPATFSPQQGVVLRAAAPLYEAP